MIADLTITEVFMVECIKTYDGYSVFTLFVGFCKEDIENTNHFLLDCPQFKENFDSIWSNLDLKIIKSNHIVGIQIANLSRD